MQSEASTDGDNSRSGALRYYKSKHRSPPIIYVQDEGAWMSFRTDGTQRSQGTGSILPGVLTWLEEIDQAQADVLVPAGLPHPEPDEEELDGITEGYAEDAGLEFRPRAWRYLLWKAIRPAFLLGAAAVIVTQFVLPASGYEPKLDDPLVSWPFNVVWVGCLSAGLFVLRYHGYRASLAQFVVRVSDTEVTGPPRWWSGREDVVSLRQTILLTNLDRARSRKRGLIDRCLGRQYLYSVTGERIYLQRWAFAGADLRRMLDLLVLQATR